MSVIAPYAVLAFVILAVVLRSRREWAPLVAVAWVLLAAGFAAMTQVDVPIGFALSVAAIAPFAVVPTIGDRATRLRVTGFSASVTVAVVAAVIFCLMDATTMWGGKLVLFSATWAALAAAIGAFMAAASVSRRPLSLSIPVVLFGTLAAVYVAGTGRSSLPDAFYGFSLRSSSEPLQWVLPPVPGFDSGVRLMVAAPAPQVEGVLFALLAVAGVAGVLVVRRQWTWAKRALGLVALGGGGLLAALPSIVAGLSIPAADPYSQEVKRRLLTQRISEQVNNMGHFTGTDNVSVGTMDLAPEIVGLVFVAAVALFAVIALVRDNTESEHFELSRDLMARGVVLLWAAWFLLLVIHNGFLGAPGMGSPGEWAFTGVCLAATGFVVATWQPDDSRLWSTVRELAPGLIVVMLMFTAALSWRFGAIIGLSLGLFE